MSANAPTEAPALLEARDLCVSFSVRGLRLRALRSFSLSIHEGESLALVGESGSGKTVFAKTITGMLEENGRVDSGSALFDGKELTCLSSDEEWRKVRGGGIATVFQDPLTSLNPLKGVGGQIAESARLHQGLSRSAAKEAAVDFMRRVGIAEADRRYGELPFRFSGGMRQRVVIAAALACKPRLLVCDEPTTALDVTIQAQILDLVRDLKEEHGFATLYITHDLGVVANVADRVAVMYAGRVMEHGLAEEVFHDPRHPYTWALLSSLPQLGVPGEPLFSLPGAPPSIYDEPEGGTGAEGGKGARRPDPFAARNPWALGIDHVEEAPEFRVSPTHGARTWLLDPRAPGVEPPAAVRRLRETGFRAGETPPGREGGENGN